MVHTAGPDDHCVICGDAWPCPTSSASYDQLVPRQLDPNSCCAACQSGGIHHPMCKWWAYDARLPAGDLCGCTVTDQLLTL